MRKALLYLFFLGMLLTNSCSLYAFAFPREAMQNSAFQKQAKESYCIDAICENYSIFHKNDLVTDFDDYDEYDYDDNHQTSLKDKSLATATPYVIANTVTAHFTAKSFGTANYTHVNFSRLPRHNYISLRVLRL